MICFPVVFIFVIPSFIYCQYISKLFTKPPTNGGSDQNTTSPLLRYSETVKLVINTFNDNKVSMKVYAFNTNFEFFLVQDKMSLSNVNVAVHSKGKILVPDKYPVIYSGVVYFNESYSENVFGSLVNNMTHCIFEVNNEYFYIQPAADNNNDSSTCIMYKEQDAIDVIYSETQYLSLFNKYETYNATGPKFRSRSRSKRMVVPNEPRSCGLKLTVDHRFYRDMCDSDFNQAIREVYFRFKRADGVFRSHDFNSDGIADNFGFELQKVDIFTTDEEPGYLLKPERRDSSLFLISLTSEGNKKHCLEYTFTSTHFYDDVVGVAFTASTNIYDPFVGICSDNRNLGVVSGIMYGKKMTTAENILVFIHELGHSFGSIHDEQYDKPNDCLPHPTHGKYIMSTYTSSIFLPRAYKFSPCSISSINPVISKRRLICTKKTTKNPICGNTVIEHGEQCDCGLSHFCDKIDKCCTPSDVSKDSKDKKCSIRFSEGKRCSPKLSPCCDNDCSITKSNRICKKETECLKSSRCNGKTDKCPPPEHKDNLTACGYGRFCSNGKCQLTLCHIFNFSDCVCLESICVRCCQTENSCKSVNEIEQIEKYVKNQLKNPSSIYVSPGSPCNKKTGICDAYHRCKVFTYKKITDFLSEFLNPLQRKSLLYFLAKHWYYIFLIVLFTVCVSVFSAKYLRCIKRNFDSEAKRFGKLEALIENIKIAIIRINAEKLEIERIGGKIPESKNFVDALFRLKTLFPVTSTTDISKAMESSSSEIVAVKQLLWSNHQFVRLFKITGDHDIHSKN